MAWVRDGDDRGERALVTKSAHTERAVLPWLPLPSWPWSTGYWLGDV
jgi:hypothetical protein